MKLEFKTKLKFLALFLLEGLILDLVVKNYAFLEPPPVEFTYFIYGIVLFFYGYFLLFMKLTEKKYDTRKV